MLRAPNTVLCSALRHSNTLLYADSLNVSTEYMSTSMLINRQSAHDNCSLLTNHSPCLSSRSVPVIMYIALVPACSLCRIAYTTIMVFVCRFCTLSIAWISSNIMFVCIWQQVAYLSVTWKLWPSSGNSSSRLHPCLMIRRILVVVYWQIHLA